MCDTSEVTVELMTTMVRDFIDCPHCKKRIQCGLCAKDGDESKKSPRKRSSAAASLGCRKCAAKDVRELEVLRTSVEQKTSRIRDLETALREQKEGYTKALTEMKATGEKTVRKEQKNHRILLRKMKKTLTDRLQFLELQVPRTAGVFEMEAVALVITGSPWIWAHRQILVAKSVFFNKMLQGIKVTQGYRFVAVRDTTHPILMTVVNFCYSGAMKFSDEITPEAMLEVSHKYGIAYLKDLCDEELCKDVNPQNISKLIKLAKSFEAHKLKAQTMDYLKENFEVMRETVFETI